MMAIPIMKINAQMNARIQSVVMESRINNQNNATMATIITAIPAIIPALGQYVVTVNNKPANNAMMEIRIIMIPAQISV